jgi:predicted ATPase/signal transduction histidine kinase
VKLKGPVSRAPEIARLLEIAGYEFVTPLVRDASWLIARARQRGVDVLLRAPSDDRPGAAAELEGELAVHRRLITLAAERGDSAGPPIVLGRRIERRGDRAVLIYDHFLGAPLEPGAPRWRDPAAAFALALAAADALERLHALGAVHGALCPAAIWVDDHDQPRVRLAALSQVSFDGRAPRLGEGLSAAIAYIAPEQSGRTRQVCDARVDLYALGAALYAALAGAPPFVADDPLELLHAHLTQLPPPLAQRAPAASPALAAIIEVLLAKNPEDRYASAAAVRADLMRAAAAPRATFTPHLGYSAAARLVLPVGLYGRDDAQAALLAAFERAAAGERAFCLVAGASGVGKSALVAEHAERLRERLRFTAGRFEPQRRSEPFSALTQAFNSLLRQVLAGSEGEVDAWRERLRASVGGGLSALVELVPDVQRVVGALPAPAPLPAAEQRQRLHLALQRFIACFALPERPLLLLLDDLQWADLASLRFIEALASGLEARHLVVALVYRSDELRGARPLQRHLEALRALAPPPAEIELQPLDRAALRELVVDALGGAADVDALVDELLRRSQGNPLFAREYLRFLHLEAGLRIDASAGAWTWRLAGVAAARVPVSVAELIGGALRRLPEPCRRALTFAAHLGGRFDLELLAALLEIAPADAQQLLEPALALDLIVPAGPHLRFFHDRVRQAAAAELPAPQRPELHLRVALALLARDADPADPEALFEIVAHLGHAGARLLSPALRRRAAALHREAARRARDSASYEAAANYLEVGLELLGPEGWASAEALTFELHAERVACDYLSGERERALTRLDALSARPLTPRQRAQIEALRVTVCVTLGQIAAAIDAGRRGLALLGVDLPVDAEAQRAAVADELAAIQRELGSRPFAVLMEAPALVDPDHSAALGLLQELLTPANMTMPQLYALIIAKQVRLTIDHGHTSLAAFTYVIFGFFLATARGAYRDAESFGRFAIALNDRRGSHELRCRLRFVFASYTHFSRPLPDVLDDLQIARREGLDSGDYNYLSFACSHQIIAMLALGRPLVELAAAADDALALMQRTKVASSSAVIAVARQFIAALAGETIAPDTLTDASFDEGALAERLREGKLTFALRWYYLAKLQLAVLFRRASVAVALLRAVGPEIEAGYGFYFTTELPFFGALALADGCGGGEIEAAEALPWIDRYHATLDGWAAGAHATYAHRASLVDAERARLRGDHERAAAAYDGAIRLALAAGYPWHAALAAERAAAFFCARGQAYLSQHLLRDACELYERWGAAPKAAALRRELAASGPPAAASSTKGVPKDLSLGQADLDLRSVLRASQTLAAESNLDELVRAVLRIVAVTAGASGGVLVLHEPRGLTVVGEFTGEARPRAVGAARLLDERDDVPAAPIRLSFRALRQLTLDDPELVELLRTDPALRERRPRSLLCLPLALRGQGIGVLYLENSVTRGVFTPARVETLRLLSAQIATSIEQARLVARLDEARSAAEAASRSKSAFLANMSHELRTPLNAIIGYAELIGEIVEERGDEELLRDITRVQRAGAHLLQVISDILDLSKIEAERLTIFPERFDARALALEVAEAVGPAVQRGANVLRLDLPRDLGDMFSDPTRVRQILLNVLGNAAKFTDRGTITLRASRDGDRIRFIVEDTGVGMSHEQARRIFEAFHQADGSSTRRASGTGLGLTITRHLCELLGGAISVVSAPGRGSTFVIELAASVGPG